MLRSVEHIRWEWDEWEEGDEDPGEWLVYV